MHQIVVQFDHVPLAAGVESQVERLESPFGSPAHHAGFHVRPGHLTLYCLCIASPLMPAASGTIPHLIKGLVTDQMYDELWVPLAAGTKDKVRSFVV